MAEKRDAGELPLEPNPLGLPYPLPGGYLRPEDDNRERARRVSAVLSAECGFCGATAGIPCTIGGEPFAVLQKPPLPVAFAHFTRITAAVQSGRADPEDVRAQFGGTLPAGIDIVEY